MDSCVIPLAVFSRRVSVEICSAHGILSSTYNYHSETTLTRFLVLQNGRKKSKISIENKALFELGHELASLLAKHLLMSRGMPVAITCNRLCVLSKNSTKVSPSDDLTHNLHCSGFKNVSAHQLDST